MIIMMASSPDDAGARPRAETNTGKVCIITGSNTGIGLNAAIKLARDGFELILACRNAEKAQAAVETIKRDVSRVKVTFIKLDLSSLQSVREFVDTFHKTGKPLHVLCNNAGLTTGFRKTELQKTKDGLEMTFAVNHLGHFLLTVLLLDELKKTAEQAGEARVVVTTSSLHDADSPSARDPKPCLDFDNLMLDKPGTFNGQLAYGNSKLANVLFTYELARRMKDTGVTANCLCPGFIPDTGLIRNESWFLRFLMAGPLGLMLKWKGVTSTLEEGGMNIFHLASDSSLKGVSGKYFRFLTTADSSKDSNDEELARRLWDVSAELVKYESAKNI